ncbi:hypothetical protein LA080_016328 [Diaporthe eres]|nr:hypothetical protein LA080_016328 [Diaporthe eres]
MANCKTNHGARLHKNPIGSDKREKNSPTQSRPAQHTSGMPGVFSPEPLECHEQRQGSQPVSLSGEPRLCQLLVLRSGIQGDMSARAIRAPLVPASSVDRHLYVPGVKQLDAANALQPYTAMDYQLLTWVRPPCAPQPRPSPPCRLATGEVELDTAVGIVLIETRNVRGTYFWSLQLAELGGTLDSTSAGDYTTAPADPVAMGGAP